MVDMTHLLSGQCSYVANKIRVMADWTLDVFFKRDVTMLRSFVGKEEEHRK